MWNRQFPLRATTASASLHKQQLMMHCVISELVQLLEELKSKLKLCSREIIWWNPSRELIVPITSALFSKMQLKQFLMHNWHNLFITFLPKEWRPNSLGQKILLITDVHLNGLSPIPFQVMLASAADSK